MKQITIQNCKLKTYLIGSIESPGTNDYGESWRQMIVPELSIREIYAFDPTKEESQKVGMSCKDLSEKLHGWQMSGNWEFFMDAMDKIWKGDSKVEEDPITKEARNVHILGDVDYVAHSDFLIWYLHEGDKLGGTIAEIVLAWTSGIPVYLVTSVPKTQINKSVLYFTMDSGHRRGKAFKTFPELFSFLDGEYKL